MSLRLSLPLLLCLLLAIAPEANAALSGNDLLTGKTVDIKPGGKGTVVVFLSASCPCSNAHIAAMKKLSEDFKSFAFAAIHSNADEALEPSRKYFRAAQLPFPVLQDTGAKIADEYKASKTPHAYVLSPEGKIVYKGGVTSSASAAPAAKQYLRNALADLSAGRAVQQNETRTLGCMIARD